MSFFAINTTDNSQRTSPPMRGEIALLILIVVCGFTLRTAYPSKMSIEHFDEGIYASNVWFGEGEDFRYPDRHLYAPPLSPFLLEWSVILFGPSAAGTMLIGIVCGGCTIGLIWWVARRWFGAEAGIAASTLAAFSDFHLLYSRTALTDVLLSLFVLLAVYFTWEAFRTMQLRWIVAAGMTTGLAWWTKYNGWLPLAIGLSGAIPWVIFHRSHLPQRYSFRKVVSVWLGIAITASVVWSPVWWGLQSRGGYQAVSDNHRQYLVGMEGWFDSLIQQLGIHRQLEGWMSCLGLGFAAVLALVLALLSRKNFTWNGSSTGSSHPSVDVEHPARPEGSTPDKNLGNRSTTFVVLFGSLCAACLLLAVALSARLGSSVVLGCLALGGIFFPLWSTWKATQDPPTPDHQYQQTCETLLAHWLLAAWFVGLLVATPFYRPYPRLTLPWLLAAWLGSGAAIGWGMRYFVRRNTAAEVGRATPSLRTQTLIVCFLGVISVVLIAPVSKELSSRGVPGWQNRTGLQVIADKIVQDISSMEKDKGNIAEETGFVIHVYGEPALVFHFSAVNSRKTETHFAVQPVGHLNLASLPEIPVFLVTGSLAQRRDPTLSAQLNQLQETGRLKRIAEYPYVPSDLVLLNHYHPSSLADSKDRPREIVRLYRIK